MGIDIDCVKALEAEEIKPIVVNTFKPLEPEFVSLRVKEVKPL